MSTPASLGYRMPAEWEVHRGTWLSWPHKEASWPGKLDLIPPIFATMVGALASGEEVHLNILDQDMSQEVTSLLGRMGVPLSRVFQHRIPTNDAWCRDHGPMFVQRRGPDGCQQAIVNWRYNSWGEKYPPYDLDDAVPVKVAQELECQLFEPGLVMEGGALDVNGRGTLITTESCLLNPNRNPSRSKPEIEQSLKDFLGVSNVLWLGEGIVGDDTDGHVDDITRFVDPTTVVTAVERDPSDPNYQPLKDNLQRLKALRDQDGRPLDIVELPMPKPVEYQGERLPASYANFYIGNQVVLMPGYDPESNEAARKVLAGCFPTRQIVTIPSEDLVWGLGSCHCLTQQWPRC